MTGVDGRNTGAGAAAARDTQALERWRARFAGRFTRVRDFMQRHPALLWTWRIAVAVAGVLVIIAGILMLIFPGPGWLTIFLGLAILGSEFAWARRLLTWVRVRVYAGAHRLRVYWRAWRAARAARRG